VSLIAFADPDFERAQRAAARFGARAFDSHVKMLDVTPLDAVYICIPPFAHGGPERDLIDRNIPFFVEKPITLDIELAKEIAAGVKSAGLITGVGYHWRYLDTVEEARRLLQDNPAQLLSGYWLDQTPPPQWWWKTDLSGGQMVEQTTHIIDLARYLIGDVTDVYGRVGFRDRVDYPDLDVPAVSTASLTFKSGVIANLSSTCLLGWAHRVGLHIFADRLAIELTDHDIMSTWVKVVLYAMPKAIRSGAKTAILLMLYAAAKTTSDAPMKMPLKRIGWRLLWCHQPEAGSL